MSVFSKLAPKLFGTLRAAAGVTVRYARGGSASGELTAVPTQSTVEGVDAGGGVMQVTSYDWIVDRAALAAVVGGAGLPERGDTITRESGDIGGGPLTYQVIEPLFKPMDADQRQLLRIYTQLVSDPST